jgi:hypothetical protein
MSLDPALAQPYTTLALIAMNYDWAWDDAERLYRRAIDVNPNYATAHLGLVNTWRSWAGSTRDWPTLRGLGNLTRCH